MFIGHVCSGESHVIAVQCHISTFFQQFANRMIYIKHIMTAVGSNADFQRDLGPYDLIENSFILHAVNAMSDTVRLHVQSIKHMFANAHFPGMNRIRDSKFLSQPE